VLALDVELGVAAEDEVQSVAVQVASGKQRLGNLFFTFTGSRVETETRRFQALGLNWI
jgi:hypothetical protein